MVSRVDCSHVDPRGVRRRKDTPVTPDPQTSPYRLLILAALSQAEHELSRRRRSPRDIPVVGKASRKRMQQRQGPTDLAPIEATTKKPAAANTLPARSGK